MIAAVAGICIFLVSVVVPLFEGGSAGDPSLQKLRGKAARLLFCELNEYRSLGLALHADGVLSLFEAASGEIVEERRLVPEGLEVVAHSRSPLTGRIALALSDGSLLLGSLQCATSFIDLPAVGSPERRVLETRGTLRRPGGVADLTPLGQLRLSFVQTSLSNPLKLGEGGAHAVLVDYTGSGEEESVAAYLHTGKLVFGPVVRRQNLETGETSFRLRPAEIHFEADSGFVPTHLLLSSRADQLYLASSGGVCFRFDPRAEEGQQLEERARLCDEQAGLTALEFMLGEQSLLAADGRGGCASWFLLPVPGAGGQPSGRRLERVHLHDSQGAAIQKFALSPRNKCFATGALDGSVWIRHLTSRRTLARCAPPAGRSPGPVVSLEITPKSDAVIAAFSNGDLATWSITMNHPETTPSTVFAPVWYEGYGSPAHAWQSSSGTDDFEPKLGLVPLIFGTLKATFYALLLAVPVALLAALFTSEILGRRARALVKPGIELMASLPSVVLGFLAALVLAPFVETHVASILLFFLLGPVAVLGASYAWLFVPRVLRGHLEGLPRLCLAAALVLAAGAASLLLGPLVERLFFLGDFRAWLAPPRRGSAFPFWAGASLFPGILAARLLEPRIFRGRSRGALPRRGEAAVEATRALCTLTAGVLIACLLAGLFSALGFDPRDALLGTYVQRNTLIVGFAMGFAVIPIIYTLSEDALSAVPEHLRAAALGCGATPWQTATRVVLPTALSGIFSAVMVGLGRAVGETMIVVMAAGNTPILEVNPFNGLRALSATIAVELPEAVKDGTLYRMLFLAALVLFVLTFAINTVAEVVRMRFRRRAFEL